MARPSFSFSFTIALCLLCTSCLDLAVNVDFKTATTGQVRVEALAYRMAQGLQMVEGSDRVEWPQARADWQALVDQVPGAALVSWSGGEEDLGWRSSVVVSFSTARALEGLFVVFKQKLTLLQDNAGKWTVTLVPQVPRLTAGDADSRRVWTALWGSVTWTFGFTPPGKPRVQRAVTLAELAGPKVLPDWTVSW